MARHIIPLTIHVVAYVMYGDGEADAAEEALARYVSAVADGASKTDAITAARKSFKAALEEIPF